MIKVSEASGIRLLLLACDEVGLQTSLFLRSQNDIPVCLILDVKDRGNYNSRIVEALRTDENFIFFSDQLKSDSVLRAIKTTEPDLGILAWWPYIIDKSLITIPERGFINFHPGYLPYNRGKDPNFWAIASGTPFGVTIHYVNEGVDTGDIIVQKKIEINWEDTGRSLYVKAKKAVLDLFREYYTQITSDNISSSPQVLKNKNIKYHHSRSEIQAASEVKLDKKYSAKDLLNLIRARTFAPHPAAWFKDAGEKYEVRINITKMV